MKLKKILLTLLFLLSFAVMIFSLIKIVLWGIDTYRTKKEINKIKEIVNIDEIDTTGDDVSKFINVDFEELKKVNSDVVGWIRVDGTNIDYPFVQYKNNSYYLNHSFDKSVNDAGWVFLDYRNNIDELDTNTIIYAHGRVDGTMFGSLKNTLDSDFFKDKGEKLVKLSTVNNSYLFEIFSAYRIPTTDDYLYNNFGSSQDYEKFLDTIKNRSIYNFSVDVLNTDKIITLSTCYNSIDKVVVHAKLVDSKNAGLMSNSVGETKTYDK